MQSVLRFTLGNDIKAEWIYRTHMLLRTLKPADLHKQVCLWGVAFPERTRKLDCGLESSGLDRWTPFYRHGTALKKISPTLLQKTSPNYPARIQQSVSQKERIILSHNTLFPLPLLMHLYNAWLCSAQENIAFNSGEYCLLWQIQRQPEKGFRLRMEDKSQSRFASSWESGTANFKKSYKLLNVQWLNNTPRFCGIWVYCIFWHFSLRMNKLPGILCNVKWVGHRHTRFG